MVRVRAARRRLVSVALSAGALAGLWAGVALAAAGDIDPTFGDGGTATPGFGWGYDGANDVVIQPDGKIVVAGTSNSVSRFAVARLDPSGSLDPTFSDDGKARTDFSGGDDFIEGVALQADGKIVVAGTGRFFAATGTSRFAVARFNGDGSLDDTFGGDGKVTTDLTAGDDLARDVVVQPDGRIVVVGTTFPPCDPRCGDGGGKFEVVRYKTNGAMDRTFSGDGHARANFSRRWVDSASGVALQPDGRIVVAGSGDRGRYVALARFLPDGTFDSTFGGDGKVTTDFSQGDEGAADVALQSDGKIVIAGGTGRRGGRFLVARYRRRGALDATFGGDGSVTTNFSPEGDGAGGVALQDDGKIVAIGTAGLPGMFAVARYRADGTRDGSFGGDGKVTTDFTAGDDLGKDVAIQADGKIVAVGAADFEDIDPERPSTFAIARYLAD